MIISRSDFILVRHQITKQKHSAGLQSFMNFLKKKFFTCMSLMMNTNNRNNNIIFVRQNDICKISQKIIHIFFTQSFFCSIQHLLRKINHIQSCIRQYILNHFCSQTSSYSEIQHTNSISICKMFFNISYQMFMEFFMIRNRINNILIIFICSIMIIIKIRRFNICGLCKLISFLTNLTMKLGCRFWDIFLLHY